MKEQRGLAGHILGGGEVSGIVTSESGVPLTVTSSGTDPGGLGILGPSAASPRPDLVGNPNSGAPHTTQQWFNIAAFAVVPAGQARPGNSGRGVVRGPGIERWDFSAFKNIRIREAMRLQFRGELFNIFDHTNFDALRLTFGPSNFGQWQPRVIIVDGSRHDDGLLRRSRRLQSFSEGQAKLSAPSFTSSQPSAGSTSTGSPPCHSATPSDNELLPRRSNISRAMATSKILTKATETISSGPSRQTSLDSSR